MLPPAHDIQTRDVCIQEFLKKQNAETSTHTLCGIPAKHFKVGSLTILIDRWATKVPSV
jgi:hypothetical protein